MLTVGRLLTNGTNISLELTSNYKRKALLYWEMLPVQGFGTLFRATNATFALTFHLKSSKLSNIVGTPSKEEAMISLEGLDKAAVLAALYNASRPQGMGFLEYDPRPMDIEEARRIVENVTVFGYLKGRVMRIDLSESEFDHRLYDCDNGEGTAERVIALLRETGSINSMVVQVIHSDGRSRAADRVKEHLQSVSTWEAKGCTTEIFLGLDEVAKVLDPAVDKAVGETQPPGHQ